MLNVMVVDDSLFMRMILKEIIEKQPDAGVVGEAVNGMQAIEMYSLLQPDIIFMDITMPDMDGIEAAKEIIKLGKPYIIMCSAIIGQKPIIEECLMAGAKDFITKPFKEEQVIKSLEKSKLYMN